jgi:hypothetical protein
MRELENEFGFRQTKLINIMDNKAMQYIAALKGQREITTKWKRFKLWFFYDIPNYINPSITFNRRIRDFEHEYRGIRQVTNVLIWTNILLWILILLFSIPWYNACINLITLPNIIATVSIIITFFVLWKKWRRP